LHGYISKTKNVTGWENTVGPWIIRRNAHDLLQNYPLGARAVSVSKKPKTEVFGVNDFLLQTFRNSVPKEFTTTPIHVLCSNVKEISRREVSERMRCLAGQKARKKRFSPPFLHHFGGGSQMFAGERAT